MFVFDRSRLAMRYRLDLVNKGIDRDEHEERVPTTRRCSQTFCILFRRALLARTGSVQVASI
jgi:hypothetical protein